MAAEPFGTGQEIEASDPEPLGGALRVIVETAMREAEFVAAGGEVADGVEGPDGHDDVKAIAEQLRLALHGKKQSVTVGSDTVKPSILLLSEEPASRLKEDGSEDMVYEIGRASCRERG